jgi:choline transporter-like protein 2/4/5
VGFFYVFLLRIPVVLPIVVWVSILATIGIVFTGAWYAGETAVKWKTADPPERTDNEIMVAIYASYALYIVGGLLILLFLFMRKRIQLAMGCVKETAKAITTMPLIILFPVSFIRS